MVWVENSGEGKFASNLNIGKIGSVIYPAGLLQKYHKKVRLGYFCFV